MLRAAWKPPSMHYSSEYLSWQLGFPGDDPAKLAMAFLKDVPIGCAAVTPRRLVQAGTFLPGYVLSFVAVDPSARGRGLAGALYQSLLDALPAHRPVIAFAVPESTGEHLLLRAFGRTAFTHYALRQCRAAGFASRVSKTDVGYSVEADSNGYASARSEALYPNVIFNAPTTAQVRHYNSDPRGRSMLVIRRPDGQTVGTAMSVPTEIITPAGSQHVVMLESLNLFEPSAEALRAIFTYAARHGEGAASVVAPNVSHLEAEVVKGAGARLLPSAFSAHLFATLPTSVAINATNLEVI